MNTNEGCTVIGFWADDTPVSVGVIEGKHGVAGGAGVSEGGPWATFVDALRSVTVSL